METPIDPPDNPQQVSLGIIKQEEGGEQSKSGLHQAPGPSSLENAAHEKMEKSEISVAKSEECGSLEDSFTGESSMEQSEDKNGSDVEKRQMPEQEKGSQGDDIAMDEISESNTEQDTTGEMSMSA